MDDTEGNAIELHGDEEIIEVIDLNDTEPCPGREEDKVATVKHFFSSHISYKYGVMLAFLVVA